MHLSSPPRTPLAAEPTDPIVLRDGSVATLRLADASDRNAMHGFFRDLSRKSRYTRFFTPREPSDAAHVRRTTGEQILDAEKLEEAVNRAARAIKRLTPENGL